MRFQNRLRTLCHWARNLGLLAGLGLLLCNASCGEDTEENHEIATLAGHRAAVRTVAFSPDGATLASGSDDTLVQLWDMTTLPNNVCNRPGSCSFVGVIGKAAHSPLLPLQGAVGAVAFSSDGSELAVGLAGHGTGRITIYSRAAGTESARLEGFNHEVQSLAYSPDGVFLAGGSGSSAPGALGELVLWEAATKKERWRVPAGHLGGISGLVFSPDGQRLATFGEDRFVHFWNTTNGQKVTSLSDFDAPPTALAFDAKYEVIAVASHATPDGPVIDLFRAADLKRLIRFKSSDSATRALLFLADKNTGTILAYSADNGMLYFYRLGSVAENEINPVFITRYYGHNGRINGLVASPLRKMLASAGDDGNVILWNVAGVFPSEESP